MWQDYVFAFVQAVLTLSLVPMIFQKEGKPTLWSSVPTAVGCAIFSFTFATLDLWFSVVSAGTASILWAVLAFQRMKSPSSPQE